MREVRIEYAAKTNFHEDRNAAAAAMVPPEIRAQVDAINEEIRAADDEQFVRVTDVCLRAGLPIPERRG